MADVSTSSRTLTALSDALICHRTIITRHNDVVNALDPEYVGPAASAPLLLHSHAIALARARIGLVLT